MHLHCSISYPLGTYVYLAKHKEALNGTEVLWVYFFFFNLMSLIHLTGYLWLLAVILVTTLPVNIVKPRIRITWDMLEM